MAIEITAKRVIVEALGSASAGLGHTSTTARRLIAEVIGTTKSQGGVKTTAKRLIAEVISSTGLQKRMLAWTGTPLSAFSVFMRVQVPDWGSNPGQMLLTDNEGVYLGVLGDGDGKRIVVENGNNYAEAEIAPGTDTFTLVITSDGSALGTRMWLDELTLGDELEVFSDGDDTWPVPFNIGKLNGFNLPGFPGAGALSELQVYNRLVTDAERDYLRAYFVCNSWNADCNPKTDLPAAP